MSDPKDHYGAVLLWLFALMVAFAGLVSSVLIGMAFWADNRLDDQDSWIKMLCLQTHILDETYCQATHRSEQRQFGADVTECPLRDRFQNVFDCPDFTGELPAGEMK